MIISASRRTDIPAYFSDWFYNRVKEGFVLTRNPMNHSQVRRVSLAPDAVTGFVFWTKNPIPILARLDELSDYMYYFQFSLTPYGKDIEPNLPDKNAALLPAFKGLAAKLGVSRVVWRYDPILLSEKYTVDYHINAFGKMAEELRGYTEKVTISFIDTDYRGVKNNMRELALVEFTNEAKTDLASELASIAQSNGLQMDACALPFDFTKLGIERARCIDGRMFDTDVRKDRNQRPHCGCASSVDIGAYNTCANGCRYCYANFRLLQSIGGPAPETS